MPQITQTHRNHYVPQWYQRRFLAGGRTHFHYLDLAPETLVSPGGKRYERRRLLRWGPKKCLKQDDLYTVKLGRLSTDAVERHFFGPIDAQGETAVAFFVDYELRNGVHDAYQALITYMGAQRFRTPRGLDWLMRMTASRTLHSSPCSVFCTTTAPCGPKAFGRL